MQSQQVVNNLEKVCAMLFMGCRLGSDIASFSGVESQQVDGARMGDLEPHIIDKQNIAAIYQIISSCRADDCEDCEIINRSVISFALVVIEFSTKPKG